MNTVITDPAKVEEVLNRGVHEIFTREELKKMLLSGEQLHIKLGTDVTGPNLHLGHTVIHRKLRDLQELGHKVTLIIGDFTTLVGDHSDKVDMRKETSKGEIKKNEEKYKDQFFKTVIEERTEVVHNSDWLSKLKFSDVIELSKLFTVAQILDRDTFLTRYKEKNPIGLDEFLYPLMQGYDSVELDCDIEIGGTDQTFNLLAGRKIMEAKGMKPQTAIVMKLLAGGDGKPMGKSLQNFISVLDDPINMYGKIMSIVDEIVFEYFELLTRVSMEEIAKMENEVKSGTNPMKYKKMLALEIVSFYHSKEEATKAEESFENTVQSREVTDDFTKSTAVYGKFSLLEFLKNVLPANFSSQDIKRTVQQGGVEVNDDKITEFTKTIDFKKGDIVKFGKRLYIKIE